MEKLFVNNKNEGYQMGFYMVSYTFLLATCGRHCKNYELILKGNAIQFKNIPYIVHLLRQYILVQVLLKSMHK